MNVRGDLDTRDALHDKLRRHNGLGLANILLSAETVSMQSIGIMNTHLNRN